MSIAAKSAKRQVHVIFAPEWSPSRPWAAVVKEGRAVADILCQSADSLVCAEDAIEYAQKAGLGPVHAEAYLCDQWMCRWQVAGALMYGEGLPRNLCDNLHKVQGWDAAYLDDTRPYRVMGWPVGQEVAA